MSEQTWKRQNTGAAVQHYTLCFASISVLGRSVEKKIPLAVPPPPPPFPREALELRQHANRFVRDLITIG